MISWCVNCLGMKTKTVISGLKCSFPVLRILVITPDYCIEFVADFWVVVSRGGLY